MKERDSYSSIIKSATLIMACTVVFKLLGFIREFVLAYFFGTSGVSDAFLISQTIPGTLFDFVGAGLTTCFIPIFYKAKSEASLDEANSFTNKILTLIFVFATVLIVVVWIDTPFFITIFASGFSGDTMALACNFTKIGILSLYFSALVFVYGAYLQTHKIFLPNAATAILQSIIVLFSIYAGASINLWYMPIGCALAIGLRLIFIYPSVKRAGLNTRIDFHWRDRYVRQFFILLLPVVFGVAVNDLNTIFDRTIASQVATGAISALMYGNSLIQLANGGIVQPVATVYYPYITKKITEGNIADASSMLRKTINLILFIFIPLTCLFMLFSRDITKLLFGRGAFDENSLIMTSQALFFYSIGICFIGVREILSRYYYACRDTRTPVYNAAIGVICNIFLNLTLSRYLGIRGLALATSASAIVTAVLLLFFAEKKISLRWNNLFNIKEVIKAVLSSIVMTVVAFCFYSFSDLQLLVRLIMTFIISISFFLLSAYLLKTECLIEAILWIRVKMERK